MFRLSIIPEPEIIGGKPIYFWSVLRLVETKEFVNCGHGWAESITQAAIDANEMYKIVSTSDSLDYML